MSCERCDSSTPRLSGTIEYFVTTFVYCRRRRKSFELLVSRVLFCLSYARYWYNFYHENFVPDLVLLLVLCGIMEPQGNVAPISEEYNFLEIIATERSGCMGVFLMPGHVWLPGRKSKLSYLACQESSPSPPLSGPIDPTKACS